MNANRLKEMQYIADDGSNQEGPKPMIAKAAPDNSRLMVMVSPEIVHRWDFAHYHARDSSQLL